MSFSAPTPEEVLTLYNDTADDFNRLVSAFQEDDKYYELDFLANLGLPKEYENDGVVLPTARDIIDTFADYVDITNAKVSVARRKDTDKGFEESEQLRRFGAGLIYMTNVQSIVSPWRVAAKHYPLYGVAWFKTVFNGDLWPDKPSKKKGESQKAYAERLSEWEDSCEGQLPIVIQAINPQNIIFDTNTMGNDWVIECSEKKITDVLRKYKTWNNPRGLSVTPTQKVDYVDYWDKDYRCVLIDGVPVLKTKSGLAKHGYGFVPYLAIDAGLGNVTSDGDLSKRFVGINRYIKNVLISQSRDYSIRDILIKNGGFPAGVLEGPNAGLVGKLDLSYGTYTPLPEGVTLKTIEPILAPDEITAHYYASTEIIDGHAIPRSLRGQSESGVRSGSDRRQILAAAQYRLRYSEMAFKHRTAQVLNNCARLLKIIPGNVRVWSRTPADEFDDVIDKNKIHEPVNFHVDFSPVSEEDEYRRHDDYERMIQSGLVTREWARKQMPNVSVKDLERQELRERIRNSPAFAQFTDEMVGVMLRAAGASVMAAEGLPPGPPSPAGAPAAPPAGMVPPNRAVPNFGSAAALQQGMKQNRSQVPMNPTQGQFGGGARGYQR